MKRWLASVAAAAILAGSVAGLAASGQPSPSTKPVSGGSEARTAVILSEVSKTWFRGEWDAYRTHFVSDDGRVIDNANGGVSHSEGQGYGLLLALEAGDAASFSTIWRWTADHLQRRSDALFAWKWNPVKQDAADLNDAADGDLLIGWALARAAKRFGRADYEIEARRVVTDLAAKLVMSSDVGPVLMPGAQGFGAADQSDGPVVNPSYWVFPALRDLPSLVPGTDWNGLRRTGFKILEASRFGPRRLPSDWIALGGTRPAPARSFPARFGYDAIRIPLYLAGDPDAPRTILYPYTALDLGNDGSGPAVTDVSTGRIGQKMAGAGYRAVFALVRCAVHGEKIPPDLMSSRDALYYPETLRLLALSIVQERFARCL